MLGLHFAFSFIKHRLSSKCPTKLATFDNAKFLTEALYLQVVPYAFESYYDYVGDLLSDDREIKIVDLGAGSRRMGDVRKVKEIAKNSAIVPKYAALLTRLVYLHEPKRILELGTSLGSSAFCMGASVPESEIVSVDACPNTHAIAKEYLDSFVISNVKLETMPFDEYLESSEGKWDFVFLDGAHTYEATLRLVNKIIPKLSKNGILLIDDIHWSRGMSKAWKEIKKENDCIAIDLFRMGMLVAGEKNAISLRI